MATTPNPTLTDTVTENLTVLSAVLSAAAETAVEITATAAHEAVDSAAELLISLHSLATDPLGLADLHVDFTDGDLPG